MSLFHITCHYVLMNRSNTNKSVSMCVWSCGAAVAPGTGSLSVIRISKCLWLFSWRCAKQLFSGLSYSIKQKLKRLVFCVCPNMLSFTGCCLSCHLLLISIRLLAFFFQWQTKHRRAFTGNTFEIKHRSFHTTGYKAVHVKSVNACLSSFLVCSLFD